MRAVIYARYSTDNQREASIEDQVRICRARAEREGWTVVDVYADYAISGAAAGRPRFQQLLSDVRTGRFDVVIAEALDRISRDQEHIAGFYKQLTFANVRVVTLAEGDISELHIGLKGTMSALFLKDLALKTHRGLEGRVRAGHSGGGLSFGYHVLRQIGADGMPTTGDMVIDPTEAAIIRRVFDAYISGQSPRAIGKQFNAEAIAGPRGGKWTSSLILGNAIRETGLLRNRLYVGERVWNRQHFLKDPMTGKRVARPNPREAWIASPAPDLRIIDPLTWEAAQARLAAGRAQVVTARSAADSTAVLPTDGSNTGGRLAAARRPAGGGATAGLAAVRPGALRAMRRADGRNHQRWAARLRQSARARHLQQQTHRAA
jgi:DNA invertase Pin-like site-specific DNA recombinase